MNPNTIRPANWKVISLTAMRSLLCLGLGLTGLHSMAGDVSMTTGDGFGEHSFDSAGHWDSAAAPTSGNNYFTSFILRSPSSGSSSITFAGDSLTLSPGGALYQKLAPLVMTVNTLTNGGRVVNAQGGAFTVLGNMYVPAAGMMDTGSGNSSATDSRTITNGMTISGEGILTNLTTDANWSGKGYQAAQGTVVYTGNNTAFTGPQIAMNNTVIQVGSQANLGGNPASFNAAQLVLDNGILRPSAGFSLNNPNSGITIGSGGGKFDIASGIILTNAEALAGAGTLSLTNAGTLMHSGSAADFTGTLSVGGGTLALAAGGSLAGANTINIGSAGTFDVSAAGITLASGQTLAGNGTVVGTVTTATGSKISPGGAGVAANLAIGSLTLTGDATVSYDFSATTNDVVMVGGNLSPSGVTSIQLVNVPVDNGTYTLITVGGTLGGSAANFQVAALSTRTKSFSITYDQLSTPKRILLNVSGSGSPASLVWQGDGGANAWDINTTANWLNGVSSDVYYDGDAVNFTDAGAANQPTLDVVVNPAAVNFNNSSDYTLTGVGAIAGGTALSKGGTGTVTVSVTNTYTGGTIITNGVLTLGTTGALGSPDGAMALAVVSGTGTLDINGSALDAAYTNIVQVSGPGASATQGAIYNAVGGLTSGGGDVGIGTLALLGDSTVSAASNWQIGNTGTGIIGNGYTLTKTGDASLYLKHAATSPLGGLVIAGGSVLFWDHADAAGTTATITLTNGGFIDTWNPATYFGGLTFANSLVVSDPVAGGEIVSVRSPYNHPGSDIYNGSVTLNGPLTFTNTSHVNANTYNNNTERFGSITLNGNITGAGGLNVIGGTDYPVIVGSTIYGGNLVTLNGNNSYTGPTLVSNLVQLLVNTANQSGGDYRLVDYATLDVAVTAGHSTMPMKSLAMEQVNLGPCNIGFTRLSMMPTNPVIYATNLTINAGTILPPSAGYSVGQFPLIKYDTISGSGFAGLQLGALPAGVTASLVDNTAKKTIDLQVTTAGVVWKGNVSSSWDLGITANWYNPVSASQDVFADGEAVNFDDTASSFNVNLSGTVTPAGMTVNANHDYFFNGTNIAGSGALIKNGSGTLTISNINNVFTGGTYINGGTIKLADQNYAYPYGGGALNNNLGNVTIANGGTLDVNAVQVPNYQSFGPEGYNVFLSGSGVGGNGALVNNSTNNNDNADPGYVTLAGDATVGGIGDVNIRHGVSPQLSSQSSAYTLTKVGTGQFRIRYVTAVSTNFGAVNILQGIVSYESSSPLGFGDASKPVTIGGGGGFAWGTASTACWRPLICSNNSTLYGYNTATNVFAGPVTLVDGNVNLNANYYNGMIFSNVISGAGGITLQYQGYATFAAANTYTGPTTVANANAGGGSILRLAGSGSMDNSSGIALQGIATGQSVAGALDASGRSDGTLTLVNGQTLRGDNGSYVKGNVVASSGTSILPGGLTNIQFMTFSNNLTLDAGSSVAMDVSLDGGVTNDLIKVAGAANYGGTLQLTNSGVTALTNGAAFKLFSAGSFTGNFTSIVGSPGSGMNWSFNPTNGTATVVGGGMASNPTNITCSVSGGQLTLSWPDDHLGWTLQAQTNTLGAGLSTNWVDVPGSSSSTQSVITIDPSAPTVFYRLRM